MHPPTTIRIVEGLTPTAWLWVAASGVVAGIAAIPVLTPLVADVALASWAVAAMGSAGWAWSVRRRLAELPLVLSPRGTRQQINGAITYGFRARLGHGRPLRQPKVTVRWEPDDGDPVILPAVVPARHLCGPFTATAADPADRVSTAGRFVVDVEVRSAGQCWHAAATYGAEAIVDGRFGGIHLVGRGPRWGDDWAETVATPGEEAPDPAPNAGS